MDKLFFFLIFYNETYVVVLSIDCIQTASLWTMLLSLHDIHRNDIVYLFLGLYICLDKDYIHKKQKTMYL